MDMSRLPSTTRPTGDLPSQVTEVAQVPLLVSPVQAARLLSISRSKLYALMASGGLPFVLIGSSRRLPVEGLRQFVRDEMTRQGFVPTGSF